MSFDAVQVGAVVRKSWCQSLFVGRRRPGIGHSAAGPGSASRTIVERLDQRMVRLVLDERIRDDETGHGPDEQASGIHRDEDHVFDADGFHNALRGDAV